MPQLDVVLNETMQTSLKTCILSLEGDSTALRSFLGVLSSFDNTIRTHRDKLQDETLLAAHRFATTISTITSDVIGLQSASDKMIGEEITTDILRILRTKMTNLTISDEVEPRQLTEPPSNSSYPAYIKPSYDWLLLSLGNPYPSKEMKKSISRQTHCPVKDIDAWFVDARKRIGWNKLRKTQFSNKQEKIIAAATRFFNPASSAFSDDLTGDLESETPSYDYHLEFTAMEDAARSLYSGRFNDSPSLTLPDGRGEPPATGTSAKGNNGHKRSRSSQSRNTEPVFSYPTPQPSPCDFGEQSPPSTPASVLDTLPTPSRKRRQSSSDTSEDSAEESHARPQKRSRFYTPESTEIAAVASLPSPANTIDLSEDTIEEYQSPTEPTAPSETTVEEAPRTKRKRRLSEGDDHRPTKRPHNALVVPRLQTVSDPFPIAKSFESDSFNEWFQGFFSAERQLSHVIPSPTDLEVPDSLDSIPLDVHFHQYDFSPYHPEVPLLEEPLADYENVTPGASLTHSEVPKPTEALEKITCESFSFSDDLQDFSLNLDFNSLQVPSGIDLQTPFNFSDMLNFDTNVLNQSTPSIVNWMSELALPLGDGYNVEPFPSYHMKTPVLGEFNANVRQDLPGAEDQEAKRARAELLREELRRLEADIAA